MKLDLEELFANDSNAKATRGHTLNLKKPGCSTFSLTDGIGRWNSLDGGCI